MRKPSLLFIFCLIFASLSIAQTNKIGFSSSFGKDMDGGLNEYAVNYKPVNFYNVGFNYLYTAKKWLAFETGLEYGSHLYVKDKVLERKTAQHRFSILNLPITARIHF